MLAGRKREIETLKEMLTSNTSELVAIYGRRRVGKTFLTREVCKKNIVFELTGLYKGTMKDQLQNFHSQLQSRSRQYTHTKAPSDWFTAFQRMETHLNRLKSKKKKVIFIDEFPWIATARSKFLMMFEHFWNTYCTKRDDLVVVICGSAASFMVNKIVKNKGGLHNRLSCKIRLMPFTLNEVNLFLKHKNIHLNYYDMLQLYMVVGGVPHYLNKIKRRESVAQNIDRLCFGNGDLAGEFNEVFKSLFTNATVHEYIVRTLSKTRKGITRNTLLELCNLGSGGVFSKTLVELIESGFVSQYTPFGKKTKDSLYRLSDEYSLFYLKFIEPYQGHESGTSWATLFPKQTFKSWSGFVFETICLKHVKQIKQALGVAKIHAVNSNWHNGQAQIDLLIDRDDGIINLCEMKFYNGPFTINKSMYNNLKNKIFQFKESTKTRKNIFATMITTHGISENANSLELITNTITMASLFEED